MRKPVTFTIPYPPTKKGKALWAKLYGFNRFYAGVHWAQRKEAADFWHALTKSRLGACKVRRRTFAGPVKLTFWFNDRLDLSNHAVMVKFIEDAMTKWVIEDDGPKWVREIVLRFHEEDCVRVEVKEV